MENIMALKNLVLNGSAEDFLISVAKNIKDEVEFYFDELHKEGKFEIFKSLPPFAQRVTFFQEVGYNGRPYMQYRNAIYNWILYGNWKEIPNEERWFSLHVIKDGAGSRAKEIIKFEKKHERLCRNFCEVRGLDEMERMRKTLIESNPILMDNNIPLGMRRDLFMAALKGNEDYKKYQKHFDDFVKKVVSSMISNYLLMDNEVNVSYRQYTQITEKA